MKSLIILSLITLRFIASAQQIDEDLIYIAKKLNMSSDQLRAIVSLPGKWHTDYPNNKFILGKMYDLYRLVFRKEKLTNF